MRTASALLLTLGCLSAPAQSQTALETSLNICWSCHGAEGRPKDPTIPIIWGQQAKYIEKQLRDYRSGDRDSQIMSSMAESVRRDDIQGVAAFVAQKNWPARPAATSSPPPDAVAACAGCHAENLMGGASPEGAAPRLAGQTAEYLEEEMKIFARGERAKQPTMTAMMKSLSPEERAKIARYLSQL